MGRELSAQSAPLGGLGACSLRKMFQFRPFWCSLANTWVRSLPTIADWTLNIKPTYIPWKEVNK